MFCPHCGLSARPTDSRCSRCGGALGPPATAVGVLTPTPQSAEPGKPETSAYIDSAESAPTIAGDPVPSGKGSTSRTGAVAAGAPPFTPGNVIGGRYRIIQLLGAGGMGAVYHAWDNELGIAVALKTILHRPETDDPSATETLDRRFKRELLVARQVTHKNVVRIHDLGEVDGIKYITMPYIRGANLATILARDGALPLPRALRIARQIAAGLAAAHEAGVVHRDLKPANIMIEGEDEHALITDFGIAQSVSGATFATMSGAVVGTLGYMPPEQAEGKPADHRSDIYAFGLILYDMLTGAQRIVGSGVTELLTRLKQPLKPLRSLKPETPAEIEEIVSRCIEREAADRYQTTPDVVAALARLDDNGHAIIPAAPPRRRSLAVVMALTVALTMSVGVWLLRRPAPASVAPAALAPISVLVADFENRTNDPVFDGAIEQSMTIGIEGASFIVSFPRRDAHRLATQLSPAGKLDEATARLIAVREGMKIVLAGSIAGGDSGYTISAKLVDPSGGAALKSLQASAREKGDVLQAVGKLAGQVRSGLGDTAPTSGQSAASETFTAGSLEAMQAYTVAQDLANNSKNEEAIQYYSRAVQADPQFGRAYSGWAVSAFQLGRKDEAAELWKKALSLMDRMTERERYRTLGGYYLGVARNYEQAIDNYQKLVDLYPADRAGHNNLAVAYFSTLNYARALEEGRKTLEIYKGSFKFRNNYLIYALYAGDFQAATQGAKALLTEDPNFTDAFFPLTGSLLASGDLAGAREAYDRMEKTGPAGASMAAMGHADVAMYEGRYADAVKILVGGVREDEKSKNTAGQASKSAALAEAYSALGQNGPAIEAARKALGVVDQESVAVPVARVFAAAGRMTDATALASKLQSQLQTQSRVYAQVIGGEVALAQDRVVEAVDAFRAAARLQNVWLARFDLGIAYERAGHHAEALAELTECEKRRGEVAALFLDDIPSYRYAATLPYWLGRAQQGVGMQQAASANFEKFLRIRANASTDPLVADARSRIPAAK